MQTVKVSRGDDLFPAHAGVIPITPAGNAPLDTVPRTRGGDPAGRGTVVIDPHCSPHTRG